MHSSVIVSALFAAVAFSSPLAVTTVTTETSYVTEVVKVYVDAAQTPAPAPAPAREEEVRPAGRSYGKRIRYHWAWGGKDGKTSSTAITEELTETGSADNQPAETPVVDAPSTPTPEVPVQQPSSDGSEPAPEPTPEPTTEQAQTPASETTQEAYQPSTPDSTPEPAPVQSQTYTPGSSYKDEIVNRHNAHRANHSAPALEWDDELADIAREIGAKCIYDHFSEVRGVQYGQNLMLGTEADNVGKGITRGFYNGELLNYPGYGFEPDVSTMGDEDRQWGHFSQMVWKSTKRVGCYTTDCTGKVIVDKKGQDFSQYPPKLTVCNYGPPGNMVGDFPDNVLPPSGQPMLGPWGKQKD